MPRNTAINEPCVLHEDTHFLVLDKPTGISTTAPEGSSDSQNCLATFAKKYLLTKSGFEKCHASSRLDKEVSGVVTFAKTKQAIEHLLTARSMQKYQRVYLGIVLGKPIAETGNWNAPIAMDATDPRKRVAISEKVQSRGSQKVSETHFQLLEKTTFGSLLKLEPQTGRTHQLRVHCAHAHVPLFGDWHYGGERRVTLPNGIMVSAKRVMLHCRRVKIPSINNVENIVFESPIPKDFEKAWIDLGGQCLPEF